MSVIMTVAVGMLMDVSLPRLMIILMVVFMIASVVMFMIVSVVMFMIASVSGMAVKVFHVMVMVFMLTVQLHIEVTAVDPVFFHPAYLYFKASVRYLRKCLS